MNQVFVNEAFTKAINDYLDNKKLENGIEYNSFLVVFIRLLMTIYNELDIINPFMIGSEETLKSNLNKFGYSVVDINTLFDNLQKFYEIDKENIKLTVKKDNPFFITVQKQLVDMLIAKKMNFHLTEKDSEDFYKLLYTQNSIEPLIVSYNYLTASDVNEIDNYFHKQLAENIKIVEPEEKNILSYRAYEILNYPVDSITKMTKAELEKVNRQVYDFFKIRENAINKEYLLEKAIEEYEANQNKVSTGNGYVDILLVMGVICTIIMVITIITFVVI
ncbi:MAG: hypothetical protein RSE17_02435 [Bacilli bacterium]